jgi:glucosamine 6-phosphate synthetase-like amidotransferase/phosphosugar isomerase protein
VEKLNREKVDQFVEIPKLKILSSLLCLIPLHLIANEISVCLDINPDKPRNLAKTVIVRFEFLLYYTFDFDILKD